MWPKAAKEATIGYIISFSYVNYIGCALSLPSAVL